MLCGAVVVILVPIHVQAQADTLRGRVHDGAGRPLVRAEVELVQAGTVALTDREGNFAFALPKYGRLTVVVSAAGYARMTRTLEAQTGVLDITLQPAAFELAPVEVTALRNAGAVGSAPLATSVVGQSELRRNHSVSLAHSLQSSPGVRTLATGQQVGKPVVRGLFGSRVLVLESGLRLEDYSWSDEDAPSIDARLADRVEIVRGPGSVLYGSDAVGGVVNVIPEALPIVGAGPAFLRTGAELYFASNNLEAGTVLRAEGAPGNFGWRGTAVGRKGQGRHTPDGELANTGFGGLNGEAEVGFARGSLSSSLRYVRYGGEFKLLEKEGPPAGGEGEEEGPERKLADDRIQLQAALPLGAMR